MKSQYKPMQKAIFESSLDVNSSEMGEIYKSAIYIHSSLEERNVEII